MESIVFHYLTFLGPFAYALVFLGMIFEGETVLFIAAFLTNQGFFDLVPLLLTVLWGMILGDNLWYLLGRRLRNSSSVLARWGERIAGLAKPFDDHLRQQAPRTIFLSKFALGLNHAILVRAGTLGIRWKKLEQSDILAVLLWVLIVGSLGYFSSASFYLVRRYLRFGEVALALGLAIFFLLQHFISKGSKKKL